MLTPFEGFLSRLSRDRNDKLYCLHLGDCSMLLEFDRSHLPLLTFMAVIPN